MIRASWKVCLITWLRSSLSDDRNQLSSSPAFGNTSFVLHLILSLFAYHRRLHSRNGDEKRSEPECKWYSKTVFIHKNFACSQAQKVKFHSDDDSICADFVNCFVILNIVSDIYALRRNYFLWANLSMRSEILEAFSFFSCFHHGEIARGSDMCTRVA